MTNIFKKLWQDNRGQGMVELALILSIVSIAAVLILPQIGTRVSTFFQNAIDALQG